MEKSWRKCNKEMFSLGFCRYFLTMLLSTFVIFPTFWQWKKRRIGPRMVEYSSLPHPKRAEFWWTLTIRSTCMSNVYGPMLLSTTDLYFYTELLQKFFYIFNSSKDTPHERRNVCCCYLWTKSESYPGLP